VPVLPTFGGRAPGIPARAAQASEARRRLGAGPALWGAAAVALAASGGCDVPSGLPNGWDTEFQLETSAVQVTVAQLLPGAVSLAPGGAAFVVDVAPANFGASLLELCPVACAVAVGATVAKPAFHASFWGEAPLPDAVVSGTIATGRVRVSVTNRLGFDPLRPSAAARGRMTLTLRSGGVQIGQSVVVEGESTVFPPGAALHREIDVSGAFVSGPISVEVAVDSPAGDPVLIGTGLRLDATATPLDVRVASATVAVQGRPLTSAEVDIDLSSVGDAVRDRVKRGSMLVTIANPFQVSGTLTLRLSTGSATVVKPLLLAPGTTERVVPLSRDELRALLGKRIVLQASGAVWGPGAGVLVTPLDALSAVSRLHFVLGPSE